MSYYQYILVNYMHCYNNNNNENNKTLSSSYYEVVKMSHQRSSRTKFKQRSNIYYIDF